MLLAIREGRQAADFPVSEDGFFSMTVARNIANGNGVTIDGTNLTNGFQPLFTFISTPIFSIENKLLSVRLLIILQVIILGLTAYLLGHFISDYLKQSFPKIDNSFHYLVSLLYISGQTIIIKHLNGLETGFYMLMIVLTGYYFFKFYQDNWKSNLMLGLLLGLTVLTRIDFAFFVVIFVLVLFIFDKSSTLRKRLSKTIVISMTALVVSLPWWIYNYTVFGSVMPISGQAQQSFDFDIYRIFWSLYAVFTNFEIFTTKIDALTSHQAILIFRFVFFGIVFAFVFPLFGLLFKENNSSKNKRFKVFLLTLTFFSISLIVWYTISNWAVYFYPRYFMPLSIVSVFILSLALLKTILINRKAKYFFSVIFPIMSISFIFIVLFKIGIKGSGFLNNQLPLIEKNVPITEQVAAGQTGTIGYFIDKVVNLDGKVNYEALHYRNNMWEYLDKKNITWFCDWKIGVENFLGKIPENRGWLFVEQRGNFLLYHKSK